MASSEIKKGIYRHYKGQLYEVLGLAHHSETLEPLVVYQALYHSKEFGKEALWVRPLKLFLGAITFEGKKRQRFEFIPETDFSLQPH